MRFLSTGATVFNVLAIIFEKTLATKLPKSHEIVKIVKSIKETLFSMTKI